MAARGQIIEVVWDGREERFVIQAPAWTSTLRLSPGPGGPAEWGSTVIEFAVVHGRVGWSVQARDAGSARFLGRFAPRLMPLQYSITGVGRDRWALRQQVLSGGYRLVCNRKAIAELALGGAFFRPGSLRHDHVAAGEITLQRSVASERSLVITLALALEGIRLAETAPKAATMGAGR